MIYYTCKEITVMFDLFGDLFEMDETDFNAIFMATLEEDELEDFDKNWDKNYGNFDNEQI